MPDLSKKIDQLGELLDKHGLTAISVREGETEIEVRRDAPVVTHAHIPTSAGQPESAKESGTAVLSPITGIFYRRPSPDEPLYVEEGDRVERGDPIGLIEAMKVFSPVESTASGVIKKILAEDGKVVQEGDPIMIVGD
ncbi:MAG: biotin/lipoyl-containing protein [Fimbriimonadales bacterium]